MANAAFTMVQNDMVILELWLKYYTRYFETVHVIGNGTKDTYEDLKGIREKYNCTFERIPYAGNSEMTVDIVKKEQKLLLENHDWVLYSDCDEIIVPYEKYKDLREFMNQCEEEKVYCEGYDVLQDASEQPIDYTKLYFQQRRWWAKDVDYNKPLLSKIPLNWAPGCHREMEIADTTGKDMRDTGLYLLHLKYADLHGKERDFGPTRTQIQWEKVVEGEKIKTEIPKYIRELL